MSRSEVSEAEPKSVATAQPWQAPRFLTPREGPPPDQPDIYSRTLQRLNGLLVSVPVHHRRGIALGFGIGCLVTLPLAVFASGRLSHSTVMAASVPRITVVATRAVSPVAAQPVAASKPAKAVWRDGILPTLEIAPGDSSDPVASERIRRARDLLHSGKVGEARALLSDTDLEATPEGAFALAETFDPNVLASLNLSHAQAEVERARRLYAQALVGGLEHARQRLDGLR